MNTNAREFRPSEDGTPNHDGYPITFWVAQSCVGLRDPMFLHEGTEAAERELNRVVACRVVSSVNQSLLTSAATNQALGRPYRCRCSTVFNGFTLRWRLKKVNSS